MSELGSGTRSSDPALLPLHCFSIDLEVGIDDRRIHKLAGVRSDTNQGLSYGKVGADLGLALARLDELATGADVLLGHNLIVFDRPHLEAVSPNLRMLRLPVIDTLWLNPLAFPRNPYHYLVKHYQDGQLKRGSISDPELDARLALQLFSDQLEALRETDPELLTAWHWLTSSNGGEGFDAVFRDLRCADRPSEREARDAISRRLEGMACLIQAAEMIDQASLQGWSLAYALAWLSVAGGNSVMPPWVRYQFPEAGLLIRRLRDTSCHERSCNWCRSRHDARNELARWFGFDDFRAEPSDDDGRPIQRSVVEAAMAGEHLLALLPTGAGKSLCYQLPALSRYDKTGALTVVISPLVALMADQVAGLETRGIDSCVTINSLLSMPERADALDRVRLGDASMLIIAPEQLRSSTVTNMLAQREIATWVLDEAHCLSKWGHDFRPDYRYVGRFIERHSAHDDRPQIICLTATAKPDVVREIREYFEDELGVGLRLFDGGSQRANLDFVVVETNTAQKLDHIFQLLESDLPPDEPGGAIIYCATKRRTEEMAEFLQAKGVKASHFHGELTPERKKDVQRRFIAGELPVIAATNAFGMGIDKSDVRLVIHADIPGSLENYLQEAGRAGRDGVRARCILLHTSADVERQFGLSARSRLTRREIHGLLKALRNLKRRKHSTDEVIATAGEMLAEDDDYAFERDSATDDTRVRTAIAWLEEAALLTREQNRTQVFPSSLRVNSVDKARSRITSEVKRQDYGRRLLTIAETLIAADPDRGISTDELMLRTGLSATGVRQALYDLERLGIASNDTAITAYVHHGIERSSKRRFSEAAALEESLLDLLRDTFSDMQVGDESNLHLRLAAQRLKDDGHKTALPERLRRLVRSVAADGRGEGGAGGSLSVRGVDRESLRLTLRRDWSMVLKTATVRREAASMLLDHLLSRIPAGRRGADLLAETTLGELLAVITSDAFLPDQVGNPAKLMERALLWLHEQEIVRLHKGLTVLRPAMTVRLSEGSQRFTRTDFQPLEIHYLEQVLQIHVMAQYAERGLESLADALRLAGDYFALDEEAFLERWLPGKTRDSVRQTTPESWRTIVDSLNNRNQRMIVADDREQTNVLVLAGPGSGKTRVLVHRIAYLLRVRRQSARGILALAYNRHAAVEIRRRLFELVGEEAYGVTVLTCHSLAMRLVGATFEGRANRASDTDFDRILKEAIALLRGDGLTSDDADEQRERLLAGFRWILVDEYQDIESDQYELISALAGRTLADEDRKLSLFAVGDDDQNIYAFGGASVEFIRRFEADYGAKPAFLTDNYRSTRHIIDAANTVIAPARERMKTEHAIHIDRRREREQAGGAWQELDPVAQGRVQILQAGDSHLSQAQTAVAELQRLARLSPDWSWSSCAVIARNWRYLDPVRSLCELEGIPVQMANEDTSSVWFLRETQALLDWLRERDSGLVSGAQLTEWIERQPSGPWIELLGEAVADFILEAAEAETTVDHFREWLAEWSREARRRQRGVLLLTAHRAKGLEFDHVIVLDGGWQRIGKDEDADAARRLYYVAMTRARQTLALAQLAGPHPYQDVLQGLASVVHRAMPNLATSAPRELTQIYRRLSLGDVFLSFAGGKPKRDPVHRAISALSPGDRLQIRRDLNRWQLLDREGAVVGLLARSFEPPPNMRCSLATVAAITTWSRSQSEPEYQSRLRCDKWEVVLPEIVFEPYLQQRRSRRVI
ncbi:MAG: RecQ family ATP-dependent DNA helicase [Chloroflexi bacterium]|nr:RecQ family ATP-dependent DNA helicase [Chloroflexota bacterium]